MELEALDGADKTIKNNRPVLLIEKIKSNSGEINAWLKDRGYVLREVGNQHARRPRRRQDATRHYSDRALAMTA
jgi:hypothetical protein